MRQIGTLVAVIEQLEWNIRVVLTARVQWQTQLGNVAALWINCDVQYVSFYVDQVFASSNRCFGRRAGISRGARDISTVGSVVTWNRVGQSRRGGTAGGNILSRQSSLTIVLVPFENHNVGHDCQGDDQDRAFNIHDYSAIEEEREVGIGGTGS